MHTLIVFSQKDEILNLDVYKNGAIYYIFILYMYIMYVCLFNYFISMLYGHAPNSRRYFMRVERISNYKGVNNYNLF